MRVVSVLFTYPYMIVEAYRSCLSDVIWKLPIRYERPARWAPYSGFRFTPNEELHVYLDYAIQCVEPVVAWKLASRWFENNLYVVITIWRPDGKGNIKLIAKNKIHILHEGPVV